MKAFVTNLDKNLEQLAFMQEQFARLGMEVERQKLRGICVSSCARSIGSSGG